MRRSVGFARQECLYCYRNQAADPRRNILVPPPLRRRHRLRPGTRTRAWLSVVRTATASYGHGTGWPTLLQCGRLQRRLLARACVAAALVHARDDACMAAPAGLPGEMARCAAHWPAVCVRPGATKAAVRLQYGGPGRPAGRLLRPAFFAGAAATAPMP